MVGTYRGQKDFKHTWFLREWMAQSLPPRRQADLIRDLGWPRAKASTVWNGQQYNQAMIDELSTWLNVRPWELLMHPDEAMAIRRLRQAAVQIAADNTAAPAPPDRPAGTGTEG